MVFLFQTVLKITGIHQYSTAVSSEVTESSRKPSLISWFDDVFIPFTSKQSSWYALMNTGPLLPVLNSFFLIPSHILTQFDTHSSSSFMEIFG